MGKACFGRKLLKWSKRRPGPRKVIDYVCWGPHFSFCVLPWAWQPFTNHGKKKGVDLTLIQVSSNNLRESRLQTKHRDGQVQPCTEQLKQLSCRFVCKSKSSECSWCSRDLKPSLCSCQTAVKDALNWPGWMTHGFLRKAASCEGHSISTGHIMHTSVIEKARSIQIQH